MYSRKAEQSMQYDRSTTSVCASSGIACSTSPTRAAAASCSASTLPARPQARRHCSMLAAIARDERASVLPRRWFRWSLPHWRDALADIPLDECFFRMMTPARGRPRLRIRSRLRRPQRHLHRLGGQRPRPDRRLRQRRHPTRPAVDRHPPTRSSPPHQRMTTSTAPRHTVTTVPGHAAQPARTGRARTARKAPPITHVAIIAA